MTFRQQVTWARRAGLYLVASIALLLGTHALLSEPAQAAVKVVFDAGLLLLIGLASVLLVFGGFARPLQKKAYHWYSDQFPSYRRVGGTAPLRFWLWLTPEGEDRDA